MTKQKHIPIDELLALDHQLCFTLHAASRALTRMYTDRLAEFDVTFPQYLVLLVLWEWEQSPPERPTMKALGDRLEMDSSTLTAVLHRLADKDLLTRGRSEVSARELCVHLTPEGKALKRKIARVPREILKNGHMSLREVVSLRKRLRTFRANLGASVAMS